MLPLDEDQDQIEPAIESSDKPPLHEPAHHSFQIRKIKSKKKKKRATPKNTSTSHISSEPTLIVEQPGTQNLYE